MTSETDEQFVERIESRWMIAAPGEDIDRLFALARRGADAAARISQLEAALREIRRGAVWNADIEAFISTALREERT